MGNICRSPTAEGVFRKLVSDQGLDTVIHIDSAGTHAYHVGEAPDRRAQAAASNRNIDLSALRGRKFKPEDFEQFDYILAMDRDNYNNMAYLQPAENTRGKLSLFLDFAANYEETEVPDPYYGGARGFEFVLDLVEDASRGLLEHIRTTHRL
jgi:protein-tyrosine phosphatase